MRTTWLSRRGILASLAALAWVPGCLLAGWWQATVAMSGNALSYLYAVEWPAFALFGVYVWWHLVHGDPATAGARGVARLRAAASAAAVPGGGEAAAAPGLRPGGEEEDEELRAYNEYLASLAHRPKTWLSR